MKTKFLKYNNKPETFRERIWYNNLKLGYGWKTHLYNFEIHNEMRNIVKIYTKRQHSKTFNMNTKSMSLRDVHTYIVMMSTQNNSIISGRTQLYNCSLSTSLSLTHTHTKRVPITNAKSNEWCHFDFLLYTYLLVFNFLHLILTRTAY